MDTNLIGDTYGISLANMIDRIVWIMEDMYPDTYSAELRVKIIDFMLEKGDDAVIALYGFIRYIQLSEDKTPKEKDRALNEVIRHDINGRKDKFQLPRSSEYKEYAKL